MLVDREVRIHELQDKLVELTNPFAQNKDQTNSTNNLIGRSSLVAILPATIKEQKDESESNKKQSIQTNNTQCENTNRSLIEQVKYYKARVLELERLVRVKKTYTEAIKSQSVDLKQNPQIGQKLATKAAGKIAEMRGTIDTLLQAKEKDRKF